MALAWRLVRTEAETSPLHTRLDGVVYLIREGKLDVADGVAREALCASAGDASISGRAHSFLGEIASVRGRLEETTREYDLAIADLETTALVGSLARARRGRAEAYLNLGLFSSALDEVDGAKLLVTTITDGAVRRRAVLESALCEGLIRIEMGQAAAGLALWESSVRFVAGDCDPLLVGLHDLLGGLALASQQHTRREGFQLLQRAAEHFEAYGLPFYQARALESHGRRLLFEDARAAAERVARAADVYARLGALLQEFRARRWLADVVVGSSDRPWPADSVRQPTTVTKVEGIAVAGPTTRALVELAICAANSSSTVLVTGESGTGKELVARLVHARSRRASGPWVPLNCAAVPAELVDSVLFGHKKGAFTGAHMSNEGVIREAAGGTLFLDEIGELPVHVQAKLLRFLQEGEVLAVGDSRPTRVDVRVVAATNRDLERDARDGRFREDLYHRLNVIRLEIAPLRDRKDEIPALAGVLAESIGKRTGVDGALLTAGAVTSLLDYDWPGNVRELANILERSVALYGPKVTRESVEWSLGPTKRVDRRVSACAPVPDGTSLDVAMETFERDLIDRAVTGSRGNLTRAAASLGVSLQRLRYRMRRLGMG